MKFITLLVLFCSLCEMHAQYFAGIFPLTGATYKREGIWGKEVEFELDGQTWTSNTLPINKEFEIKLKEPTGLRKDKLGKYKPGIELLILNTSKDTLGYAENILENLAETWDEFMLKNLSVNLTFNEQSKPGDSLLIITRFFDFNSSNQLTISMPVLIVSSSLDLKVSSTLYTANSYKGFNAASSCFALGGLETKVLDTLGGKTFFLTVPEAELHNHQTFLKGNHVLKVYDKEGNFMNQFVKPIVEVQKNPNKEGKTILLIQFPMDRQFDYQNSILRYYWENNVNVLDVIYYVPKQ